VIEMTELYWILIKENQMSCWGNRSFTTEQEAVEYLRANIAYPASNVRFYLVEMIAKYSMKFEINKDKTEGENRK
jgi:hypothetical protein